jgi:outer membrane receptor protein involved in Fe transport
VNAKFSSGPDKGNRIPFVSSNVFSLGLNYKINQHWSCYINGVYNGNKTFADDTEQRSRTLGGYTLYNANLLYQFKAMDINLRINNISNKHYYAYAFDVYNGSATNSYFYPANGISAFLSVAVKL